MEFASEGIEYMEERALCTLMCAAYSPLYSAAHAQSTGNVPDISALLSVFSGTMPHARCASHRNGAVHDMVQPPLQSPAVHPHGTASQIETRDHMRIDHKAASGIVNNLIRYQKAGIWVVYTVAMEGGFGTVQQMKGRPATSYEEVDPSAVVVCKIDKAGADANVAKFIKRRAYKIFHQYHQLTRANTPVTAPFRRFLPFSPWRARARLRLKNQKSLENPSLTGAEQFCRSRNVSRQEKTRREYLPYCQGA